jgi:hypothetical protein
MGLGERSTLAGKALLKRAPALLACWATVRRGRLLPLGRTWFLLIVPGRVGAVELVVTVTIASASCLVMTRLQRWFEIGKRLPSVGRSWTSTSPLGRDRRCHAIHLLLLLRPFINEESVECMVNQLVFVCHVSTGMKMTLLTELGLW